MKQGWIGALSALALTGATASLSWANGPETAQIQRAFSEADVNNDGAINVDEYVGHSVRLFEAAGGTDTREIPRSALRNVKNADFARADRDRNGALSLGEVVADKMLDFFETDTNHDGVLSLDEVIAAG